MKKFICILLLSTCFWSFAQPNLQWKGYFSYNEIKDITESSTKITAASENALFSKNTTTNTIKTTNTVDGLSGETISAIYFSEQAKKTIIGYENGLMIVVNDIDGSVTYVVDIINKSIPANIKKINHFMEYQGILYISCDFGIVQYNINTLQFGDTYFIGPNGQEIRIYQTTIFNNEIYAVSQYYGIKKANINNPNLNDFAQWQTFDSGYWTGIVTFNNQLVAQNVNNGLYRHNGGFFQEIAMLPQTGKDLRTFGDKLITTTQNHVYVYNSTLTQAAHIQSNQINIDNLTFNCATFINNYIYIGTNNSGIISVNASSTSEMEIIMPDGPKRNYIFALKSSPSNLWVSYGGYDVDYDPYRFFQFNLTRFDISKMSNNEWLHIPFNELLNARSMTKITIDPNNENLIYFHSYNDGLLKIENDVPTTIYNESNSSLKSIVPNSGENIRVASSAYDRNKNLWVTNSRVSRGLHVFKTGGQWQEYNMETVLTSIDNNDITDIKVDRNGTKWMATNKNGVVAFNESTNVFKKITEGIDTGNLPSTDVKSLAIDSRNQVWIGTTKGLRVISSTSAYNSESQIKANSIIIIEDGLAQELLYEQYITDITVDGSNRKWIGTADSGVFLFSANGQETIYHFTKDNSPLPSNMISDIEINESTGEIFFATDKGMVSFLGTATRPADDLKNVYVYPNPVRPGFVGTVKVAGLISKANIKITDIEGNLVYETTSEGGTIEWDTTAFGKYKVASGVYMIFIAAEDGSETAVKKVMIVR
jgi:ligand-binding sensor domain-containing protein